MSSMVARSLLLIALALLVSACGSRVEAQAVAVSTEGDTNPEALAAAERGALHKPTVVFFHAEWCNICRQAAPVVEELANKYAANIAVVRMDIDDSASRAAVDRYRVSSTPTFVLLATEGNVLASIPGWPGRAALEMTIEQMVTTDQ
jgi:thiol-disulfide isomerase/thioredoxin